MKSFMEHIVISFSSFTLVTLILSAVELFIPLGMISAKGVLEIFLVTTLISITMYFTEQLPIKNKVLYLITQIMVVFVMVFLVGAVIMKWFPLEWIYVVPVSFMILCVFFGVYGILLVENNIASGKINKMIQRMKDKEEGEK